MHGRDERGEEECTEDEMAWMLSEGIVIKREMKMLEGYERYGCMAEEKKISVWEMKGRGC